MIKPEFTFGTSQDARDIRTRVFVEEQGFEREFDEHENSSWCLVLYLDNIPIATGRVRPLDPERYQIERVAVEKPYRRKSVGTYVVKFLCTKIKTLGGRVAKLNAQFDKMGFYERLGFKAIGDGEVFFEEGVAHIPMEKVLIPPSRKGRGRF